MRTFELRWVRMALRSNYVLIDFENVQPEALSMVDQEHFKIIVFVGGLSAQDRRPADIDRLIRLHEQTEGAAKECQPHARCRWQVLHPRGSGPLRAALTGIRASCASLMEQVCTRLGVDRDPQQHQ